MNINTGLKIVATLIAFLFQIPLKARTINTKDNQTTTSIFPQGEKATQNFTGNAWEKTHFANDDTLTTIINNVVFEAGVRNYWHTHPAGQVLISTEGTGYYQEKGKPIQTLYAGLTLSI